LLVEVMAPRAPASVTPLTTGTYRWISRTERLNDGSELADFRQRLRAEPDLSHLILRLQLEGTLPIADYAELQRCLTELEAAVFHLSVDHSAVVARPTLADLEAIDFDGVLRRSADLLRNLVDDATETAERRHRAEEALVDLYLRVVGAPKKDAA
jgi:hypothetical protein